VVTPLLEYYDVFDSESFGMAPEMLYKLTDSGGRLLVLRPDNTLPIARLAATRLREAPLPLRLFYTQKVYRVSPFLGGKSDEITQSGIELIGAQADPADLEVITLAAEGLRLCGFERFRLELGHAGIFKALIQELTGEGPLSANQGVQIKEISEDIRTFIEAKNITALNDTLDTLPDSPAVRALRLLPRLFGGKEVLDEAAALEGFASHLHGVKPALVELREKIEKLSALGLGEQLSLDLGMVHRNQYYTGTVFRGYIEAFGEPVLSGGRYDNLLAEFGLNLPAAGFAVNNDALCGAKV